MTCKELKHLLASVPDDAHVVLWARWFKERTTDTAVDVYRKVDYGAVTLKGAFHREGETFYYVGPAANAPEGNYHAYTSEQKAEIEAMFLHAGPSPRIRQGSSYQEAGRNPSTQPQEVLAKEAQCQSVSLSQCVQSS